MPSRSSISFSKSVATQTDRIVDNPLPIQMVLIPFEHYRTMVNAFVQPTHNSISSSSEQRVTENNNGRIKIFSRT